jgi:hypothetical protein
MLKLTAFHPHSSASQNLQEVGLGLFHVQLVPIWAHDGGDRNQHLGDVVYNHH